MALVTRKIKKVSAEELNAATVLYLNKEAGEAEEDMTQEQLESQDKESN